MIVKGASGLGDAIYMNSVLKELLKKYSDITIRTKYPEVFRFLPVKTAMYEKRGAELNVSYGGGARKRQTTSLYQDILLSAGLSKDLPMDVTWQRVQSKLCDDVEAKAAGRKICLVSMPHEPFGRNDGRGDTMIPNWTAFNPVLDYLKDKGYFLVEIGHGRKLHNFRQIDLSVANQTNICDVMNLGQMADIGVGQCGFIIPLMQGFGKKYFIILSERGLMNRHDWFIAGVTLDKLFIKKDCPCGGAVDTWKGDKIMETFVSDCFDSQGLVVGRDYITDFFKDKSVVIFGSGPSAVNNVGTEIDKFDIIVRVNNYIFDGYQKQVGNRTDVHYAFYGSSIRKEWPEMEKQGVKLCMCKLPNSKPISSHWHERNGQKYGVDYRYIYKHRANWWKTPVYVPETTEFMKLFETLGKHQPTTGFAGIWTIKSLPIKSLYITGFDFFRSGQHNGFERWRAKNLDDPIRHEPEREAQILAEWVNSDSRLSVDETLKNMLTKSTRVSK